MKKEQAKEIYEKLSPKDKEQFALIGIMHCADLLKAILEIAKMKGLTV